MACVPCLSCLCLGLPPCQFVSFELPFFAMGSWAPCKKKHAIYNAAQFQLPAHTLLKVEAADNGM